MNQEEINEGYSEKSACEIADYCLLQIDSFVEVFQSHIAAFEFSILIKPLRASLEAIKSESNVEVESLNKLEIMRILGELRNIHPGIIDIQTPLRNLNDHQFGDDNSTMESTINFPQLNTKKFFALFANHINKVLQIDLDHNGKIDSESKQFASSNESKLFADLFAVAPEDRKNKLKEVFGILTEFGTSKENHSKLQELYLYLSTCNKPIFDRWSAMSVEILSDEYLPNHSIHSKRQSQLNWLHTMIWNASLQEYNLTTEIDKPTTTWQGLLTQNKLSLSPFPPRFDNCIDVKTWKLHFLLTKTMQAPNTIKSMSKFEEWFYDEEYQHLVRSPKSQNNTNS